MIVRDGRNVAHDLGPRRTFQPSMLKPVGVGITTEQQGQWTGDRHRHLFTPKHIELKPLKGGRSSAVTSRKATPRVPRPPRDKKEYDKKFAATRRAARTPEQIEADRKYHREYMRKRRNPTHAG